MKYLTVLLALILSMFSVSANATATKAHDPKQRYAFVKTHPCPVAAPHSKASCPGMVVDHKWPRCAYGPDRPYNMIWQTFADSKLKDAEEVPYCAKIRSGKLPRPKKVADVCAASKANGWPMMAAMNCPPSK